MACRRRSILFRAILYLRADAVRRTQWRERLAISTTHTHTHTHKVGLCWAGSPQLALDRRRSIAPRGSAIRPASPASRSCHCRRIEIADWAGVAGLDQRVGNFADRRLGVGYWILVISVQTAAAQIAAALGRPVWLLTKYDACWRWLTDRDDSPWYPTMRLFRQPRPNDWGSVVARVCAALQGRLYVAAM